MGTNFYKLFSPEDISSASQYVQVALHSNQLNLFSDLPLEPAIGSPTLVMDKLAKSEVEVPNLRLSAAGKVK